MNAIPPSFAGTGNLPDTLPRDAVDRLAEKWAALHDAATLVAALAHGTGPSTAAANDFPAAIGATFGWRRVLVEQGIDDLAAVMEPGIAALLAVTARAGDPAAAAKALWQEFLTARDALLAVAADSPALPTG
jgi:hypothetical protein